jgi:hypothetical protein
MDIGSLASYLIYGMIEWDAVLVVRGGKLRGWLMDQGGKDQDLLGDRTRGDCLFPATSHFSNSGQYGAWLASQGHRMATVPHALAGCPGWRGEGAAP